MAKIDVIVSWLWKLDKAQSNLSLEKCKKIMELHFLVWKASPNCIENKHIWNHKNFWFFSNASFTKFKNDQISVNKINHWYCVATKLLGLIYLSTDKVLLYLDGRTAVWQDAGQVKTGSLSFQKEGIGGGGGQGFVSQMGKM